MIVVARRKRLPPQRSGLLLRCRLRGPLQQEPWLYAVVSKVRQNEIWQPPKKNVLSFLFKVGISFSIFLGLGSYRSVWPIIERENDIHYFTIANGPW